MSKPIILLFREDLRLSDHPALYAAAQTGAKLICLYIHDVQGPYPHGGAREWWLHHALRALDGDLRALGGRLVLRQGRSDQVLERVLEESGAGAVFWSRRYAPDQVKADTALKAGLKARGVDVSSCPGRYLFEPWQVQSKSGRPYRVFSPYWRAALALGGDMLPLAVPQDIRFAPPIASDPLDELALLPVAPDWAADFAAHWQPGAAGARARLKGFLAEGAAGYAVGRDMPAQAHVSRLSPYLQMGNISPREVWAAIDRVQVQGALSTEDARKFRAELGWREFSAHLLYHNPELGTHELQPKFRAFPWVEDARALRCWQHGQTGYPIVDAGMRELWTTGYMHNRVRMIVASFLVKHLRIDWRQGMAWFWDTLVDADIASNTASWQWVAGCGADAAPYFRIFNPMTQATKFDPDGAYIRQWVPELAAVPTRWLAAPWQAPTDVLRQAGVVLGQSYPRPMVDHADARAQALEVFAALE